MTGGADVQDFSSKLNRKINAGSYPCQKHFRKTCALGRDGRCRKRWLQSISEETFEATTLQKRWARLLCGVWGTAGRPDEIGFRVLIPHFSDGAAVLTTIQHGGPCFYFIGNSGLG